MAEDVETPCAVIERDRERTICRALQRAQRTADALQRRDWIDRVAAEFLGERRLELFEEANDLGKQLARLPKARRHEQHQTGTLCGHRRREAGALAPQRFGSPSIPARTCKSSDHFAFASCTNRTLGFQGSNCRQLSCAGMSGAEGAAEAWRPVPQGRPRPKPDLRGLSWHWAS